MEVVELEWGLKGDSMCTITQYQHFIRDRAPLSRVMVMGLVEGIVGGDQLLMGTIIHYIHFIMDTESG